MRKSTKVTIGDKETTVGDVKGDKQKQPEKSKDLNPVDDDYYKEEISPIADENGDYEGKPPDAPLKKGAKPLTRADIEKHFPEGIPDKYKDVLVRLLNSSLTIEKTLQKLKFIQVLI